MQRRKLDSFFFLLKIRNELSFFSVLILRGTVSASQSRTIFSSQIKQNRPFIEVQVTNSRLKLFFITIIIFEIGYYIITGKLLD